MDHTHDADMDEGRLVACDDEMDLPISVEQCWSAFDDFFYLSKELSGHNNIQQVLGAGLPANGVGAVVSFTSLAGITREILLQKDDMNKIWVVGIMDANKYFSYYRGTFSIFKGKNGPRAKYSAEAVFGGEGADKKKLIDLVRSRSIVRILEIVLLVLNRDGLTSTSQYELNCPIEKAWSVFSDWNNHTWILNAEKCEVTANVHGKPNRKVFMKNGDVIEEVLVSVDHSAHTLTYYVHKTPAPVKMYQGTVKLTEGPNNTTIFNYTARFLPKDGVDGEVIKNALQENSKKNSAPFLQNLFASLQ